MRLKRAGIKNFRWHDLRHVWATWHVMAGTTIAELQELGAWKSRADGEALRALRAGATARGGGQAGYIFVYTGPQSEPREARATPLIDLAPRPGLEPGTCGLTVRRSTN